MTYNHLRKFLNALPYETLNQDVTVYLPEKDEYVAIGKKAISTQDNDVLDEGHLYLIAEESI